MKTNLRFMALVLLGMMLSVNYVWGADTKTYTYDFTKGSQTAYWTSDNKNTSVGTSNISTFYYMQSGYSGHCFAAGNGSTSTHNHKFVTTNGSQCFFLGKAEEYITLPTYSNEKITKINVTRKDGQGSNDAGINVFSGSNAASTASTSVSTSGTDFEINSKYQSDQLQVKLTNNKNIGITKIIITTEPASTKTAVSVAAKSGTHEVTVGGEKLDVSTIFTITPESGTYDGTPSYEITEGSSYATLDGSTLTAVAAGTVKVKCTAPETTNFQSGNATATVTVNPKVCSKSITITKGTPSNGSFDLSQTGSVCVDDANASVDVTSISPDEHYHFKKITATNGSVDDTNKKVTNISANTTINVEFEEDAKYDITFVDNLQGTASIPSTTNNKITVYDGEAFTFPTIQDKTAKTTGTCEEVHYHFMGWALSTLTDPIAVDDIKTGTSDAVTAEATYKAVWAKEKTE